MFSCRSHIIKLQLGWEFLSFNIGSVYPSEKERERKRERERERELEREKQRVIETKSYGVVCILSFKI